MIPAYTTLTPRSLYSVGELGFDYNRNVSSNLVRPSYGRNYSRPVQGLGQVVQDIGTTLANAVTQLTQIGVNAVNQVGLPSAPPSGTVVATDALAGIVPLLLIGGAVYFFVLRKR